MIKLFSWNVNGLRAIYKKGFLDWVKKNEADIICLQETKAHEDQLPEELINPDKYTSYFSKPEKKGYSGVALYTRKQPDKLSYSLKKAFDSEGRYIKAEYNKFTLYNVYFPNGKASDKRLEYKMDFYEAFLKEIIAENKKGRGVIFCGDVNTAHKEIDLARPKQNENNSGFLPQERAWIDKVIDKGFIDTFRAFNSQGENYTWWDLKTRARDRNVGWRLDYFFISKDLKKFLKSAAINKRAMGSDHCPVSIELNLKV
jgi:exodeoxyribonuclease-3